MRGADNYVDEFDQLSVTIEQTAATTSTPPVARFVYPPIDQLTPRELKRGIERAASFTVRITPSAFDAERLDQRTTNSSLESPATLYGHWWHRFFQRLEWTGGIQAAQERFAQHLSSSPDSRTAAKDWLATSQSLFSDSVIARYLRSGSNTFHREFPFSWKISDKAVVEGVVDLLIIDQIGKRALLVDWKTNRIKTREEEQLRHRYRPQIAAYWKAVRQITQLEVQAGIFATATGQFVPYNSDELETEWDRLRSLSTDKLRSIAASLSDT